MNTSHEIPGQQVLDLQPGSGELHRQALDRLGNVDALISKGDSRSEAFLLREPSGRERTQSEFRFATETTDALAIKQQAAKAANANAKSGGKVAVAALKSRIKQLTEKAQMYAGRAKQERETAVSYLEPSVRYSDYTGEDLDLEELLPFNEQFSGSEYSVDQILFRTARAIDASWAARQLDEYQEDLLEARLQKIDLFSSSVDQDDEDFVYRLMVATAFNAENRELFWHERAKNIANVNTREVGVAVVSAAATPEARAFQDLVDQISGS